MKATVLGGLLVLALAAAGPADEEQKKFVGYWKVLYDIDNGEEPPKEDTKIVLSFEKDRVVVYEAEELQERFAYKLHPDTSPKGIDFHFLEGKAKGRIDRGIYRFNGKKLEICMQMDPKEERPKVFSGKKGTKQHLVILEKVK